LIVTGWRVTGGGCRGSTISFRRAWRHRQDGRAGFAAVDALVALVILSSALGLSLAATQSARKVAAQAARIRQAEALCRYLLAGDRGVVGVTTGRSSGLDWRLEIRSTSTDLDGGSSRLCDASALVRPSGGGTAFVMSTVIACPDARAA